MFSKLLTLAFAIVALAMPAKAQDYTPPTSVGAIAYQSWRSDGRRRTRLPDFALYVRAVDQDRILMHEEVGDELIGTVTSWRGLLNLQIWAGDDQVRLDGDLGPVEALWPLSPGKSAEIVMGQMIQRVTGNGEEWSPTGRRFRFRFRVEGEEDITIPAGAFRTWIIVREDFHPSGERIAESRIWFAPTLRWWVKSEVRQLNGSAPGLLVREAVRVIR